MIRTMVVFGATGDLTGRLLLPAMAALRARGELGPQFRLVGCGPQDWTAGDFAAHAWRRLTEHAASLSVTEREVVVGGLTYRQVDVTDATAVAAAIEHADHVAGPGPVAVYLALPTALLFDAVRALPALPVGSRVAIEKPFGQDAAGASELNAAADALHGDVYRVDHALAMTAVRHLPVAQHPGTGERVRWSSRHIERVELLWEETLGLEGRAAFYDRAGALRDVLQNHLLQLLGTIAAEPCDDPNSTTERSARRADVLRAVRPLTPPDVRTRTRRARYTAGRLAGPSARAVPDYVAEDGVDPARDTETFAEVVLELDTPRWAGTEFVLRAGKALAARRRGVAVHAGPAGGPPLWLDLDEPAGEAAAYERVLADLLGGGSAYSVGAEEAELAWNVVTPVLQGWAENAVAMQDYPAGSAGPH